MSTDLKTIKDTGKSEADLDITQFWGGIKKGVMLQLTQGLGSMINADEPGFIHLTLEDAYKVSIELVKWIKAIAHEKAKNLQIEIEKNQMLKNTIIEEAVDCERFIAELKIIDLPIRLLKQLKED